MTVDLHDTNECDNSLKKKFDNMINNRYSHSPSGNQISYSDLITSEAAKQNRQTFRNYLIDKLKLDYSTLYGLLVSLDNKLYKTEFFSGRPIAFIDNETNDINNCKELLSVINDIVNKTDMLQYLYDPPVSGDTKPDNINFKHITGYYHGYMKSYKIYYSDNMVIDIVVDLNNIAKFIHFYKRFINDN